MHSDPIASQESSFHHQPVAARRFSDPEIDPDEDPQPPRPREGLPATFRMRHGRHFVEQLMGDAPLRTVREIAVTDLESPADDLSDLQRLEQSVRDLGVLEPLLVAQKGRRYRVIAGRRRLRAALRAGLRSVPCLIHEVDDAMLERMRQALTSRETPEAVVEPPPAVEPEPALGPPVFAEVSTALTFVSDLLPLISGAGADGLRRSVLTALAGVEVMRARSFATAAEVLSAPTALQRVETRAGDLMNQVQEAVEPEARLRGVSVQLTVSDPDYTVPVDQRLVRTALTALIQGLLAWAPPAPSALRIAVEGTLVRPALMVEISRDDVVLSGDAVERFFDPGWHQHPAGSTAAAMFGGARRIARLHGGRAGVKTHAGHGCTVTFVVPRPLTGQPV